MYWYQTYNASPPSPAKPGRNNYARFILIAIATLWLSHASDAQACGSTDYMQVCGYSNPNTLVLNQLTEPLGSVNLQIVSRRERRNGQLRTRRYTVSSPDASTGNTGIFTLNSGAASVDVNLIYTDHTGNNDTITQQRGTRYQGATDPVQTSIEIVLNDTTAWPAPGTYTGVISLEFEQNGNCPNGEVCIVTIDLSFSLEVPPLLRISGLRDMVLTTPDYRDNASFCVFTSSGIDFVITADSQGGNSDFRLTDSGGSGDQILYTTQVGSSAGSLVALSEGATSTTTWPGSPQDPCTTNNMQLEISLPVNALDNAIGHNYTDVLTLTVTAQ